MKEFAFAITILFSFLASFGYWHTIPYPQQQDAWVKSMEPLPLTPETPETPRTPGALLDELDETTLIRAADDAEKPTATVFNGAIGSITPGNLFYVNATDIDEDLQVMLSIVNSNELRSNYSFLLLKVEVYVLSGSVWEEVNMPEQYISMKSPQARFPLAGLSYYRISLSRGSFMGRLYSNDISRSPTFFLKVESRDNDTF